MQALPLTTTELTGFWLYARCSRCESAVRIHPAPVPLPRLPLTQLLARLRCKAPRCGARAAFLELQLPDHGIPGTKDQYSPTWRLDRGGTWEQRETVNPFETN